MTDLAAAQSGDRAAFDRLLRPHVRALIGHCYRMTGSLADAEDAAQAAFLRAWQGVHGLADGGALRGWLFAIATRTSLDLLASRAARRLPDSEGTPWRGDGAIPDTIAEPVWVEPAPPDGFEDDPETRAVQRESVRLAFIIALQRLPPLQRAVLLCREVVGLTAEETAAALELTVAAVNSALQRARSALDPAGPRRPPRAPRDLAAQLAGYIEAWESGDPDRIVSLLREHSIVTMPPVPLWLQGPEAIHRFLTGLLPSLGPVRLEPIEIAGGSGVAMWSRATPDDPFAPLALHALTFGDAHVTVIDAFLDPRLFQRFGLPSIPR